MKKNEIQNKTKHRIATMTKKIKNGIFLTIFVY